MAIKVILDEIMFKRKIKVTDLAANIDLTEANLSILKTGKARAIRFSTLEALCRELNCQPGDLLTFVADEIEEVELVHNNFESKKIAENSI